MDNERKGGARVIYVPDHVWTGDKEALNLTLLEERFELETARTLVLLNTIIESATQPADCNDGSSPS